MSLEAYTESAVAYHVIKNSQNKLNDYLLIKYAIQFTQCGTANALGHGRLYMHTLWSAAVYNVQHGEMHSTFSVKFQVHY